MLPWLIWSRGQYKRLRAWRSADMKYLVFLFLFIGGCLSAKIAMMPMFVRSHYLVMEKLADELSRRGHEVVILVGDDASYALVKPMIRAYKLPKNRDQQSDQVNGRASSKTTSVYDEMVGLFNRQKQHCDKFLSSTDMMNEVKNTDVLIGDSLYLCSSLVADKFDLPHVVINMSPLATPTLPVFGVPRFPSYVPQIFSGLTLFMNMRERLKNFGYYLFNKVIVHWIIYPCFAEIKEKHNISPEKTITESLATVDMILLGMDFILDHAQPILPYVREVGFFLPCPAKPLSPEFEEFMQSSGDEGVIIVSFGSVVHSLEPNIVKTLYEAFSRMQQKVLFKLNPENVQASLGSNIKVVPWLPQNDILGHNKTKLFITHAGANGMAEAAYHGVPMVCSPFFGDQHDNAQFVKDIGIGEILNVKSATADQLVSVLHSVLGEKRYQENSARVSKVMRLRPRTPVQEAADLVEYVQAQGHLDHLKPRGLTLHFYQVYMLDVMAVLGLAVIIVLVVLVGLVKLVVRACCKLAQPKTKTS